MGSVPPFADSVSRRFPVCGHSRKARQERYHLHVAWCGRVNVGLVRKMWLAALGGGKGCRNIDAKHIRVPAGGDRASRIARYISKYVAKHFEDDPRYNKKILNQSSDSQKNAAVRSHGGYARWGDRTNAPDDGAGFLQVPRDAPSARAGSSNMFRFPSSSGFWLSYIPELHASDPPFDV